MLNTHQKLALAVVVVIGTATLLFDVLSLRKSIIVPFFQPQATGVIKTAAQIEKDRAEALKSLDTDKDGLSDYDELYVFRTSPYLDDSDSDGTPDGVEISQNTDPNCPAGKTCKQAPVSSSGSGSVPTAQGAFGTEPTQPAAPPIENAESPVIQAIVRVFGDPTTLTLATAKERLDQLSGEELKAFYIDLGLPSDLVNKASDSALRQLMLDNLKDAGIPAEAPAPEPSE